MSEPAGSETASGGMGAEDLEALARRGGAGDGRAVERLVLAVKDEVYNLAVRMLWHPEDAEDATQEILLRIVTRLASFRGESAFRTWVYRIATNHLLDGRRSRAEQERWTFDRFGAALASGLAEPPAGAESNPEQRLLVEEVKIGCTQGMLLCLDRTDRIAYVLGDVFELTGEQAASVLEITSATYRKRLSRARERLRAFMRGHCGLVNPEVPCRCARRVTSAIAGGRVRPDDLLFAGRPARAPASVPGKAMVEAGASEMEQLYTIANVYRSNPSYAAPERVLDRVRRVLRSGQFRVLE